MSAINHYIKIHSIFKYAGRFTAIENFGGALKVASQNRIKAEIIGQWLYCFTTPLIGIQLQAIGFWYSFKHYAYVYSESSKNGIANDETLDEIRARLGARKI